MGGGQAGRLSSGAGAPVRCGQACWRMAGCLSPLGQAPGFLREEAPR
ncbi:hypothetical protein L523_3964 [Bordetella bronchiseptica MBORD731]|nr:hypothetical protein L523_3964 [Bordetella bronchiseptica MBORD731]